MSQEKLKLLLACLLKNLFLSSGCTRDMELGPESLKGKIVGGSQAKISNFPHAVYLSMTCGNINMICGSSIINQIILVTAAHCLQCEDHFIINAKAGHHQLEKVTVVRRAVEIKTHPAFVRKTLVNDIGLIRLSKNLPLGNNIKRVIIKTWYPEKATAFVAGWGITDDITRTRSLYLKKVKVPVVDCRPSIVGHTFPGMLCAGTTRSTKDRPSSGDSGSALITTKHQQLGIVSFRMEPYIAMLVYTNVSYYYSWIQEEAKQLYCAQ